MNGILWSVPVDLPQRRRSCQNLVCGYSEYQEAGRSLKEKAIKFKSLIVIPRYGNTLPLLLLILLTHVFLKNEKYA